MGKGEGAIKTLENALADAWDDLPDSFFEQDSMGEGLAYKVLAISLFWHMKTGLLVIEL